MALLVMPTSLSLARVSLKNRTFMIKKPVSPINATVRALLTAKYIVLQIDRAPLLVSTLAADLVMVKMITLLTQLQTTKLSD